jgi:hypothetical protein
MSERDKPILRVNPQPYCGGQMSTRDKLVDALHECLSYVRATSAIDGIWDVTNEADLADWRKAREQVTEVIRLALVADHAERN